ncbi:MAG: DUF5606 domain-containing protein [Bacteroidales bacterium]
MLKDILSISGQSGLFKLVAQSQKNIIVENVQTKKRVPVYQTTKVSALDDIAIYTEDEEKPLYEVFKEIFSIENKKKTSVSHKDSANEIKDYFEDILPEYDKERVYISDMKKVISWYNILIETNILPELIAEEESQEKEETKTEESSNTETSEDSSEKIPEK